MGMIGFGATISQNIAPIAPVANPLGYEPDFILTTAKGIDESNSYQFRSWDLHASEGGITARLQDGANVVATVSRDITIKTFIMGCDINVNPVDIEFYYYEIFGSEFVPFFTIPATTTGELEDHEDIIIAKEQVFYMAVDFGAVRSLANFDKNGIYMAGVFT